MAAPALAISEELFDFADDTIPTLPPVPENIGETGITRLHHRAIDHQNLIFSGRINRQRPGERAVGLSFSVIEELIENFKRAQISR